MPHFTLQVGPNGPLVNAFVAVSQARTAALTAVGEEIPKPAPVHSLVDTGASCSCVDPSVLEGLKLTPTGSISVNTPSTGATPHETYQYDVALVVPAPGGPPLIFQTIPVIAADLLPQGFQALIGRDILSRCFFAYNGDAGIFTLAY